MSNAECVKRYQRRRAQIIVRPTKEQAAAIKAAAEKAGESVQRYVLLAVSQRMEREAEE